MLCSSSRERAMNEFQIKVNDDACSSVHGRQAGLYVCGICSQPGLQARRTRDLHSICMLHCTYVAWALCRSGARVRTQRLYGLQCDKLLYMCKRTRVAVIKITHTRARARVHFCARDKTYIYTRVRVCTLCWVLANGHKCRPRVIHIKCQLGALRASWN